MESTQGHTKHTLDRHSGSDSLNVAKVERWASLIGGSALALDGLRRGGGGGVLTALIGGALVYRGATGYCPVYGSLGINTAEGEVTGGGGLLGMVGQGGGRQIQLETAVTVDRPADELYRFWRDPHNLPRFMSHIDSVAVESDTRARWTVGTPLGTTLEWDAEITREAAGEYIAWRSGEGSMVTHTGTVRFRPAPGGRGTEVHLTVNFAPPAGPIGAAVARLFEGITETQLRADLKRFKQLMETGELATIDGQPSGRA
jgi:uncharacterized membrane protein